MIRILYMSDLHLEMERWRLPVPGWPAFMARHRAQALHPARGPLLNGFGKVDLVVLAGDIHHGFRGVVYADQVAKFFGAPVVMVAGNHEFYHHDLDTLMPALGEASAKTQGRVRFLENTVASFRMNDRNLHVLGCTLWTDYALHGDAAAAMREAGARMNDHVFITLNGGIFLPRDALARHEQSRLWLHRMIEALRKQDPDADLLIVTHHAPSGAVLGERIGAIAPAYGSDLLTEFTPWRPAAWIHGHTHYRHDSLAEGIRMVSAPRGYVAFDGPAALDFRPGLIEI